MNTTTISATEHNANVCNRLLRGEIAAVETYRQAIEKFEGELQIDVLQRICSEHESNADLLRAAVARLGGEADETAGAWGVFAKAVQGAANLLGEGSAIGSLKQGEEWGHTQYLDALADTQLTSDIKSMAADQLVPHTVEHISTLAALGETV